MPVDLLQQFLTQVGVVQHAWIPFLLAVAIVGFVIWKAVQREFATRLANALSTNDMLREKLERTQESDTIAIAAGVQQLESTPEEPAQAVAKAPAPQPTKAGPKVYVRDGMDAAYLMGIFKGRTELQADAMLKSEIGKWMIVEGAVRGVTSMSLGDRVMVSVLSGDQLVFCPFLSGNPELERLSNDDIVKIEGKIDRAMTIGIFLEDCELISVQRP